MQDRPHLEVPRVQNIWKFAPFRFTVLFLTRADGQYVLPPIVVHKGAEQTAGFLYAVLDDWNIHHTPSGYTDRDGWLKIINMICKVSGARAGNIQILFYYRHDSHWDADALDIMCRLYTQPCF